MFPTGGGEVGALMRSHEWSRSPLGAPAVWPQSLRSVVDLLLNSKFPMFVAWGPDLGVLYNDAYAEILGGKHPAALGARFRDIWAEIWPDISPLIDAAMAGEATYRENLPLVMNRHGFEEQTWFTFSYSPVRDESGAVAGMFCAVAETTLQVLLQRRHVFRLALEERLRELDDPVLVMAAAAESLGRELGAARVGYGEIDAAEEHVSFERHWTDGRLAGPHGSHRLADFGLPIINALRTGRALSVYDVDSDPRVGSSASAFATVGVRSVLAVPLIKAGRFTAVLYVHHHEPRRWSEDDAALVAEVADRTWAAVERARAEAERRRSEEQLRLATEAAEIGLWDVDEVAGTLFWPPRVKAVFGISPDVPVSMADFYTGLHPDEREHVSAAYAAAADPGRRALYDVEYRTIGKEDGRIRWVAAKGRGVFDAEGRCLRVIGTAIDITRRKADEERLRELTETLERRVAEALSERKLLADIVDGTDMFVQVTDLDYRWLAINRASADEFARIFGTRHPKAGDSMLELLVDKPEHLAAVKAVWSRALAGEEFVETGKFGDPALDDRHYEMHFRTLRDESGRRIGAYQFVHDVTERVREQKRLAEAETALVQVQKMEAVGQLTGGIAHDFNNLLQGVAGSLDLIRHAPEDRERVRRWADAGLRAAERGTKLTAQLLSFARAQKLELKPLVISDLVKTTRDLLERTLGPAIRIRLALATDGVRVLGDEVQLQMAILNLAINARDAMPDGGDLTIATRHRTMAGDPELPAGDYVELSVSDTGIGMDPHVAARAFDPFFTTKGMGKGTGLGLSQVYGTMRQVGGAVRIESRVGEGTTVRLFLTCTEGVPGQKTDRAARPLSSGPAATVLVIDDDPVVRGFLRDALQTLGYAPLEAEDGPSGLAALDRSEPDLLIVDFAMPGMSGAEVAREARSKRRDLPIIFASGFSDTAAIDAAAGHATPVLRKPFRLDELEAVLSATLEARRKG